MDNYLKALFSCTRFKKPSHQTRTQANQTRIRSTNNPQHNPITTYNSYYFDQYSRISMAELTAATKNFSPDLILRDITEDILENSRLSFVYKGRLSNGLVVAVKKLNSYDFQGVREFRAEMETLGKIRHRNILPIVGYCDSDNDRLLVFKFMKRGSLAQWLYDAPSYETPLSWEGELRLFEV
ncbi:Receptor-like kinase [Quillaja saponaria]|uniref:Receptor-like kinase n=1 Tax=Quillaja saponaria TaxID=32244 RepID=A0AAD7L1S6_QUISA|nr:Receptor-like kinase [Quillaja saponaria]